MILCEAPPLILAQWGDLAITTRSLPALLMVIVYLSVCGWKSLRRGAFGWIDPLVIAGIVLVQLIWLRTSSVAEGAAGLPGYALLAPFMVFLVGYGAWRMLGRRPLANWPWYRFGLVSTLALLMTDIAIALMTPAAPGKVWQLGGACLRDALLMGPPFLMIVFYGLLDCRSRLVFCSKQCVNIGRCRFGMDGKTHCLNPIAANGDSPGLR